MRAKWVRKFRAKQRAAAPSRYYGDGGTIHGTNHLDVETDAKGNVVAVWFRCQMLPFRQATVVKIRADEMRAAYAAEAHIPKLTGVEVLDVYQF